MKVAVRQSCAPCPPRRGAGRADGWWSSLWSGARARVVAKTLGGTDVGGPVLCAGGFPRDFSGAVPFSSWEGMGLLEPRVAGGE